MSEPIDVWAIHEDEYGVHFIDAALAGKQIVMQHTRKGPVWAAIEKESTMSTDHEPYGHDLPEPTDLTEEQRASDAELKDAIKAIENADDGTYTGDADTLPTEDEPVTFDGSSRVSDL